MGAKMDMEDIKVVLMRVLEDGVMDLTEGDSMQADVDVWGGAGTSELPAADVGCSCEGCVGAGCS
jgi:hypothetical protein